MPAIKGESYRNLIYLCILLFAASKCFAGYWEFQINCPYWETRFDRAGYVDLALWYDSERHNSHSPSHFHEMMTGDWAAAVWYQGINESNEAAWLTDEFLYPDFSTNSPFNFTRPPAQAYYVRNDPCNPVWTDPCQPVNPLLVNKADSGWSVIDDDKLQVKIYYEVADLGRQDINGLGGSPIAFRDSNGTPVYVYSERYVLLQTYVFKNLSSTEDINSLEFYQMLHGHPGTNGSDSLASKSMYETADFYDPLSEYTPRNPHHQTDNFRYDITLWNTQEVSAGHKDWMGFSSTIEPNDFGLDYFTYENYYMESAIRSRELNNSTEFSSSVAIKDIAGAMKWNLGNLTPSQTKSITLALMYGVGPFHTSPFPPEVTLTKTDDVSGCIAPSTEETNSFISYQICFSTTCNINDANIVDVLPGNVEFRGANGNYDYKVSTRTVIWNLGDLDAGDSNCFTLTVKVAADAIPGSVITNSAKMFTGQSLIATATEHTKVCCDDTAVYVKWDASGANDGSDWTNAYTDLQTALADVNAGLHICAEQIWVARGTYKPTNDANQTGVRFVMLDGIDMYGHFAGWEDSIDQRNLADTNNATILSGDINNDGNGPDSAIVVTAANNARLDGFTIEKAKDWSGGVGVYTNGISTTIANCILRNNYYGLYCATGDSDSHISLVNCFIEDNGQQGMYCSSGSGTIYLDIDRCTIRSKNSVLC